MSKYQNLHSAIHDLDAGDSLDSLSDFSPYPTPQNDFQFINFFVGASAGQNPGPLPDRFPVDHSPAEKMPLVLIDRLPMATEPNLHLDAVFTYGPSPDQLLTNDGAGHFTASEIPVGTSETDVPPFSSAVAFGDLNGDGSLDAVIVNNGAPNQLLTNDGHGNFTNSELPGFSSLIGFAESAAVGDLNGDGHLDILIAGGGQNEILTNDGVGHFTVTNLQGGDGNANSAHAVALADFNGDGALDIVFAAGGQAYFLNDGLGHFTASQSDAAGRMPVGDLLGGGGNAVAIGDLNGDGHVDIAITGGAQNYMLLNDGTGKFTYHDLPGNGGTDIAIGDLNNDGHMDIVTASAGGGLSLLINDGHGNFAATNLAVGSDVNKVSGIALGDANGDGRLDIFVALETAQSGVHNELMFNNGGGNFTALDLPAQNTSNSLQAASAVAVGDLNGDGTVTPVDVHGLPNINVDGHLPSMYGWLA